MTESRTHHRVVRNRKKNVVPLYKLRPSDVVKTVLDHPRRLEELLRMLEDKDRSIRGRAAATLSRLSESHPARLVHVLARLKPSLVDESAYVRWHLIYALGRLFARFPSQSREFLNEVVARLDDDNRIVRIFACKVLGQVAYRNPLIIEEFFANHKKEIPPSIAPLIRGSKTKRRL
jgi:hypothetical protein